MCRLNVAEDVKRKKKRGKTDKGNRQRKRKISPKKKARTVVARNTTYASKTKVADRDVVKDFLAQADCGCDKQCIKSLHTLNEEGAVDVVLNLRKQRFACKLILYLTCILSDLFAVKKVLLPHADFFLHPGVCFVASLGTFKAFGSTMADALKV